MVGTRFEGDCPSCSRAVVEGAEFVVALAKSRYSRATPEHYICQFCGTVIPHVDEGDVRTVGVAE